MPSSSPQPALPVPKNWTSSIQSALVHLISLAQFALAHARARRANESIDYRSRLLDKTDRLQQEIALLREEARIKDTRLARIPPCRRPHYQPAERLAVLELRAARSWSLAQTARAFQVTTATIASWGNRLDEGGPAALVQTRTPVNKFPEFVAYIVQRLQTLCPRLGKVKIAQVLARAGLHLGVSSVGRMRRQRPATPAPRPTQTMPSARRVTAKHPNHLWHVDLTTVPTAAGFWTSWLPFALPQCWPFCWWLAVAEDHFSRRALGFAIFLRQPTSEQVRQFLGRIIGQARTAPKYLVTDSGTQFTAEDFEAWCRRHGIRQRQGAVGKRGSIAVIERFIGTLKREGLRTLVVVALARRAVHRQLQWFLGWYNQFRPHTTLEGATPDEVYFGQRPACRKPRFEPRPDWPRASPCAKPQVLVKGQPGACLELIVEFPPTRRHLPHVKLTRAA